MPLAAAAVAVTATPALATAEPEKTFDLQKWMDTASNEDLAQYHAMRLAVCLCKQNPGPWRFSLKSIDDYGYALFVRDKHTGFVGISQDF